MLFVDNSETTRNIVAHAERIKAVYFQDWNLPSNVWPLAVIAGGAAAASSANTPNTDNIPVAAEQPHQYGALQPVLPQHQPVPVGEPEVDCDDNAVFFCDYLPAGDTAFDPEMHKLKYNIRVMAGKHPQDAGKQ